MDHVMTLLMTAYIQATMELNITIATLIENILSEMQDYIVNTVKDMNLNAKTLLVICTHILRSLLQTLKFVS